MPGGLVTIAELAVWRRAPKFFSASLDKHHELLPVQPAWPFP